MSSFRSRLLISTLLLGSATALAAQELGDPHLTVVPRTGAEAQRIAKVIAPTQDFSKPETFEQNPAGAASVEVRATRDAFSQPSANMDFERELDFKVGNGLFKKLWVSAPSSTRASDGLGPLYNARACQRCHLKDGRGHPPEGPDDNAVSMFLRISVPGGPEDGVAEIEDWIATAPDPHYGSQLQDFSLPGIPAEYRLDITYEEVEVPLSDGETATLLKPTYAAADLGYGPLGDGAMLSPRIAPQMIGLGLVEAIPAADILANADPDDANGDGISGRPNIVISREFEQPMLGRFGLKAGAPTIKEQSAAAFSGDIGISNVLFPDPWGECSDGEVACRQAPHGQGTGATDASEIDEALEIDVPGLDLVTFYSRNLGVPQRTGIDDAEVLRGKKMFYSVGCIACHTPKFVTARLEDQPEQSFQLIWPYSDFLLHDMGAGLADNRPEGRATGTEWRTAPLWGIGMTEAVSGHTRFLHDGRARNLLEAILWHGGEAEPARNAVVAMPKEDRDALLAFLNNL
ncbi:di-heme oxidoreductase family protein [Chachezhania sediminis]|uniref:di-heme oxidoreductase family protein n=1 Tax=Chachezhania sediminis TaxID=2599291 RepID=UPI00131E8B25|nr:di-heme oxidoredictase family protein [Chachezhania sediminis]